ncbi:MAG: arsenic efflux protein [Lentisphaerae bacterium]|nr:arsenic efflux protein [Lentisphaerota bacterium]
MHMLGDVVPAILTITGFVFVMMVVVEYFDVLTRGRWEATLSRWTWGQSVVCAVLGVIPGCLGAFAVASLYMHRVITAGAVVAAMIATCGDEAFVMLAWFPERALGLFAILFVVGIGVGLATDALLKGRRTHTTPRIDTYSSSHPELPACVPFSRGEILGQWLRCTPHRGWLSLLLVLFIAGVASGHVGHHHLGVAREHVAPAEVHETERDLPGHDHGEPSDWDWARITLLVLGLVGLAIAVTVPNHFLDEHLWDHIVRVHVWRILLWTAGAVIATRLLSSLLDLDSIVAAHRLPVLLLACFVGMIPESGPHLVFVALYANGMIPFSTMLASCIVQDGHGMIPVLAHSRRAFLGVKAIKLAAGLAAGLLGQALGW